MEKFGWCFIGTGRLAHQVAKQILASGKHRIVSCYTRNSEKCRAFAEEYGATPYETSLDAVLADGVEGVYVVTTHNAHFRFVKEALEAGKPVLCEKAFTVDAAEAEELVRLAREKKVYLAEAMWTWFSPCANQVKSWIDGGEIGRVSGASFTYHLRSNGYAPRVSDPKRAGGALLDITVYPIHYAYRLFGYPESVESRGDMSGGIDLGEDVKMRFPGGVTVDISASIVDMKGLEKMTVRGSEGKIRSSFFHASNRAVLKKGFLGRKKFRGPGGIMNTYLDEFDTVAAEIREGLTESRMVPLQATLDVMRIMDGIREQIGLVYTELE